MIAVNIARAEPFDLPGPGVKAWLLEVAERRNGTGLFIPHAPAPGASGVKHRRKESVFERKVTYMQGVEKVETGATFSVVRILNYL